MSFRIKKSHTYLKPSYFTLPSRKTLDELLQLDLDEDDEKNWLDISENTVHSRTVNSSKIDAKKGLVIRPDFKALGDYF